MSFTQRSLFDLPEPSLSSRVYGDILTATINDKGVLDVDTVKGCTIGIRKRVRGCYDACYAATIAKFRGIDFGTSVARRVVSYGHAKQIERAVRNAPQGFFRVGTMGDPSHEWPHTVDIVEWLAPLATPVIVTKHWHRATDSHLDRLIACGAVLNTSVSALDTDAELSHRSRQISRYSDLGGRSFARVVSCDFNRDVTEGARMADIQEKLLSAPNVIDNPLRVARTHWLVTRGLIYVDVVRDLSADRTVSLANKSTYLGHCSACPDRCGATVVPVNRPPSNQLEI